MEDTIADKRYFEFECMVEVDDCVGCTWGIVARDLAHALEILAKMDLGDYRKVEGFEISAERAAEIRTDDDEAKGRDRLSDWEIGEALCSDY